MIQEIITYMIVGAAVTFAFIKIRKKLGGKKRKQNINFKKDTFSMNHDCSSCSAECMLRDALPTVETNKTSCNKIELKSNEL